MQRIDDSPTEIKEEHVSMTLARTASVESQQQQPAVSMAAVTLWATESLTRHSAAGGAATVFDEVIVQALTEEFCAVTGGPETPMALEQFAQALRSDNDLLARIVFERIVDHTAAAVGSWLCCSDFVTNMYLIRHGSLEDRLEFTFRLFDTDNSGAIEKADLVEMLRVCLSESRVDLGEEQLARMASGMIHTLDEDQDGTLSFEDFLGIEEKYPGMALLKLDKHRDLPDVCSSPAESRASTPGRQYIPAVQACQASRFDLQTPTSRPASRSERQAKDECYLGSRATSALSWLGNNCKNTLWGVVFFALMVASYYLVSEGHCRAFGFDCAFSNSGLRGVFGIGLSVAKGSAGVTKLAFATVVFPVCRSAITVLRETFLGKLIPFDSAITWHKAIATVGLAFAFIHSIAHAFNYGRLSDPSRSPQFHAVFGDGAEQPTLRQLCSTPTSITGLLMCAILLVAFPFALKWPRQASWLKDTAAGRFLNNFNNFAATHCLFAAFYALLIFHATRKAHGYGDSWCWLAMPLGTYGVEKVFKCFVSRRRDFQILDAAIMPGKTVALQISKPEGFKYLSGQYVFLQCQELGWMEWHPFTLTSAPDDAYLGLQIRAAGDWTDAFCDLIDQRLRACCAETRDAELGLPADAAVFGYSSAPSGCRSVPPFPVLRLDGPYGTPAQKWRNYEVVVMVGAGIGVTPCTSVLRDVLNNIRQDEQGETAASWKERCKTRKVFFCWCTRDKEEAQWIRSELESISRIDTSHFLDVNIYITSVQDGQPLSNLLKIGQMSSHEVHGRDPVTGLQTSFITKFGRPDWSEMLTKAAGSLSSEKDTVGVFFCGPPAVGHHLGKTCKALSCDKATSARFKFHEEHF